VRTGSACPTIGAIGVPVDALGQLRVLLRDEGASCHAWRNLDSASAGVREGKLPWGKLP